MSFPNAEKVVRYRLIDPATGQTKPGYYEKVSNKDAMANEKAERANITPETVCWFVPEKSA
jgi:hypothetical protein